MKSGPSNPFFETGKKRPFTTPAASSGLADSESGDEGADADRDRFALKVMRDRGLITETEYRARLRELDAG